SAQIDVALNVPDDRGALHDGARALPAGEQAEPEVIDDIRAGDRVAARGPDAQAVAPAEGDLQPIGGGAASDRGPRGAGADVDAAHDVAEGDTIAQEVRAYPGIDHDVVAGPAGDHEAEAAVGRAHH